MSGNIVALCLPQRSHVTCYHSASLAALCVRLGSQPCHQMHTPKNPSCDDCVGQVSIVAKGSSMIPHLRCMIAEEAIEKWGATHLLWIDDDHNFPEDAFHRLYRHRKPIVGINASTRAAPILPTARTGPEQRLFTHEHSTGIEQVYSIGFGIILIEARVFKAMPKPWFRVLCDKEGHWWGEDAWFSYQARMKGFDIYVDHDLTKQTYHFGLVGFHSRHAVDAAANGQLSGPQYRDQPEIKFVRDPKLPSRDDPEPDDFQQPVADSVGGA